MAEKTDGAKRIRTEEAPTTSASWTSTVQVSFGQAPTWSSGSNEVPSWLSKQSPSNFGATATFGQPSTFGSASTFGAAASFGSSPATFGSSSTFGTISGESVFQSKKIVDKDKGESKVSSSKTSDASSDAGEGTGSEDDADEKDVYGAGEHAPAEWGARSKQDEENLPPPSDVATGEEDEFQVYQTKAKLFRLVKGTKPSWSELGVGPVRVNVPLKSDETSTPRLPRLIMRRQGVLKLLLNAFILPELIFELVGDNMIRFACESYTEDSPKGELASFLLKFGRKEERDQLYQALRSAQPQKRSKGSPSGNVLTKKEVSESASSSEGDRDDEVDDSDDSSSAKAHHTQ